MDQIVDIQIKNLQILLSDKGIRISIDEKAKQWISKEGYNPIYGARPLKRLIQKGRYNSKADKILKSHAKDIGHMHVSLNGNRLIISDT